MYRTIIGVVAACLFCAASSAQSWEEYISHRDRFIVNFPGKPQITDISYTSELEAPIPARVYSVDNAAGKYTLTVVDYTQTERVYRELCATLTDYVCDGNEVSTEIRGAIAFAAWNFRKSTDGELTYDAYAQVDGVVGHQLQFTHPDGSRTFVAIHMEARRLYILEGTVAADAPPPGMFQQSLGVLDENGRRVRYRFDENDNRVRVDTYDWLGADYAEHTNVLD